MLEVSDFTLSVGNRVLLEAVDLHIADGEAVGLVGPSGVGKTLFAQALMGIAPQPEVRVTAGVLRLSYEQHPDAKKHHVPNGSIGYIPQGSLLALNPVLTIGHQIDLVLRRHTDWSGRQRRLRTIEALRSLGLAEPSRIYDARPSDLSGGERQRALFAMCIPLHPRLVIADEPMVSLDTVNRAVVIELLRELRRMWSFDLLIISHDVALLRNLVDRAYRLEGGQIVPETLVKSPLPASPPAADPDGRSPILEVVSLHKRFGSLHALRGVSFSLRPSECVGLIGMSGSGKTTLARCISGLTRADDGRVLERLDGARRIQMIFQDPGSSFDPKLTIQESIEEALQAHGVSRDLWPKRIISLCEQVGLHEGVIERLPTEASGGELQRAAIARALAVEPSILIADEATSALDGPKATAILDLFAALARQMRIAVLLITHDLGQVARICSRLLVLQDGLITEAGATGEILNAPQSDAGKQLVRAWRTVS